jgi:hypothetical protein
MLFQNAAMIQTFRLHRLIAEAWFRCQERLCVICGGHIGPKTGFLPRTSTFPCQHHFTNAPYSIIPLICYGSSTSLTIKHVREHTLLERNY